MSRLRISLAARLVAVAVISAAVVVSAAAEDNKPPRSTLFVGIDISGSFRSAYDDALTFVAHYLYGHMREFGGLSKPRDLFVAAMGGKDNREPKSFHPIHEFNSKDVRQLETALRKWSPPTDTLTDVLVVDLVDRVEGLRLAVVLPSDGRHEEIARLREAAELVQVTVEVMGHEGEVVVIGGSEGSAGVDADGERRARRRVVLSRRPDH